MCALPLAVLNFVLVPLRRRCLSCVDPGGQTIRRWVLRSDDKCASTSTSVDPLPFCRLFLRPTLSMCHVGEGGIVGQRSTARVATIRPGRSSFISNTSSRVPPAFARPSTGRVPRRGTCGRYFTPTSTHPQVENVSSWEVGGPLGLASMWVACNAGSRGTKPQAQKGPPRKKGKKQTGHRR